MTPKQLQRALIGAAVLGGVAVAAAAVAMGARQGQSPAPQRPPALPLTAVQQRMAAFVDQNPGATFSRCDLTPYLTVDPAVASRLGGEVWCSAPVQTSGQVSMYDPDSGHVLKRRFVSAQTSADFEMRWVYLVSQQHQGASTASLRYEGDSQVVTRTLPQLDTDNPAPTDALVRALMAAK